MQSWKYKNQSKKAASLPEDEPSDYISIGTSLEEARKEEETKAKKAKFEYHHAPSSRYLDSVKWDEDDWTPTTFRSSRKDKHQYPAQSTLSFNDEDDFDGDNLFHRSKNSKSNQPVQAFSISIKKEHLPGADGVNEIGWHLFHILGFKDTSVMTPDLPDGSIISGDILEQMQNSFHEKSIVPPEKLDYYGLGYSPPTTSSIQVISLSDNQEGLDDVLSDEDIYIPGQRHLPFVQDQKRSDQGLKSTASLGTQETRLSSSMQATFQFSSAFILAPEKFLYHEHIQRHVVPPDYKPKSVSQQKRPSRWGVSKVEHFSKDYLSAAMSTSPDNSLPNATITMEHQPKPALPTPSSFLSSKFTSSSVLNADTSSAGLRVITQRQEKMDALPLTSTQSGNKETNTIQLKENDNEPITSKRHQYPFFPAPLLCKRMNILMPERDS